MFKVPIRTLRNWWNHFTIWGEYPYETRERKKIFKKVKKRFKQTRLVTNDLVNSVKRIVDEHPEFSLDEIQMSVCAHLKVYVPISTLWKVLSEKLNYSMQICYESAAQWNEIERALYKTALDCLISNVNQVVFIDETHKDKNASRRRKAWGKRNSGGIALKKWFNNTIQYTSLFASLVRTLNRTPVSTCKISPFSIPVDSTRNPSFTPRIVLLV